MTPMIPEHLELLKRALPLISSPELAIAVANVLMTGARPDYRDTDRGLMPHAEELFERFVVHLIDPAEFAVPGDDMGYHWAADGLEKYMPEGKDNDDDTRTH